MTPEVQQHLAAPAFLPFRLPALAMSAIDEKLGRAQMLEYASREEVDSETKCGALLIVNVTQALAYMKDWVRASSPKQKQRLRMRVNRAIAALAIAAEPILKQAPRALAAPDGSSPAELAEARAALLDSSPP